MVLVTQSIRQFPLHFPSRPSPCAITFQLDANCAQSETREGFLLALPFSPVIYDSMNAAVSKVCVADPSGSETTAQRIRFSHFRNGYF